MCINRFRSLAINCGRNLEQLPSLEWAATVSFPIEELCTIIWIPVVVTEYV